MSALGQKQTCAVQKAVSALPPKATSNPDIWECPLWAKSGHRGLFDHLIGAGKHSRWDGQSKPLEAACGDTLRMHESPEVLFSPKFPSLPVLLLTRPLPVVVLFCIIDARPRL